MDYEPYQSTRFRQIVPEKIIENVEVSTCPKWEKITRQLTKLYTDFFLNLQDNELDLLGQQGLFYNLGFKESKHPREAEWLKSFDFDTRILPLLPCETPDIREFFEDLTQKFFKEMQLITASFFNKLPVNDMRKYERKDHLKEFYNIENFINMHIIGGEFLQESTAISDLKALYIDQIAASTIIQRAFKKYRKRWDMALDEWCDIEDAEEENDNDEYVI